MNIVCLICVELMNEMEVLHVTKCGHIFHYDCLRKWLLSSQTCPQCRYRVRERSLIRLFPSILEESFKYDETFRSQIDDDLFRPQEMEKLYKNYKKVKKCLSSLLWFSSGLNLVIGLLYYFIC